MKNFLRVMLLSFVLVCWAGCEPVPPLPGESPATVPVTHTADTEPIPPTGLPVAGPSTQPIDIDLRDYE